MPVPTIIESQILSEGYNSEAQVFSAFCFSSSRSWRFWMEKAIFNILYAASFLWIESLSVSELWYQESIGKIGDPDIDSSYMQFTARTYMLEICNFHGKGFFEVWISNFQKGFWVIPYTYLQSDQTWESVCVYKTGLEPYTIVNWWAIECLWEEDLSQDTLNLPKRMPDLK